MHETKARLRTTWRLAPAIGGAAVLFLWAIVVCGQTTPAHGKSSGSYPRLPGAVTKAPAWLGADAPFDVVKFFVAVPRDQNAAPLYLEALIRVWQRAGSVFSGRGRSLASEPGCQGSVEAVPGADSADIHRSEPRARPGDGRCGDQALRYRIPETG